MQHAKTGHTHRGQAVSLPSGLAKYHHRPVDTVCDKKRVSDSISCPTQINQRYSSVSEEISYRSREDSTLLAGGRINAVKTCHRTSLFTSSEGRLLQPDFPGSEEVRRMETGDRSGQTESVHPISSLQNGNHRLSSSYPMEERLGRFSGLERCVFSYCHPSQVQEVSPFPFYGENIPISGTPVWALPSTVRFHQSNENCGKTLWSTGNAITCIPRRLAATVSLPVTVQSTAGSVTANGLSPGFVPNWDKSGLIPSQTFCFLGAYFDLEKGMIGPSLDRILRLQTLIRTMLASRSVSVREIHSLLGQMESMTRLLPDGMAHKRSLQWHVKDRWSQAN